MKKVRFLIVAVLVTAMPVSGAQANVISMPVFGGPGAVTFTAHDMDMGITTSSLDLASAGVADAVEADAVLEAVEMNAVSESTSEVTGAAVEEISSAQLEETIQNEVLAPKENHGFFSQRNLAIGAVTILMSSLILSILGLSGAFGGTGTGGDGGNPGSGGGPGDGAGAGGLGGLFGLLGGGGLGDGAVAGGIGGGAAGGVPSNPEPSTLLLMGLGLFMLKKKEEV